MKRAEHQLTLPGVESMNQKNADSYNEMMGTAVIPNEALKIDMGVAVSVEEKQALWPDEKRIDIIGSNGPTGDHYNSPESCMKRLADEFDRERERLKPFVELGKKVIGAGSGDT
ncbi:MAG: hypothetical protein JKY81_04745 [Colwellia sp.]|nr:hypothetical protein [Colwellia sp.]